MLFQRCPVRLSEAIGVAFVILIGSALHFAFEWSGNFRPLAIIAAVNESIWEHLKLAFWPGFAWALIQFTLHRNIGSRIFPIKGIALLVTSVLIATVFTSYTAVLQQNYLALDIGTFILAVLAGSAVSGRLLVASNLSKVLNISGWVLLVSQLFAFSAFTFYPPDMSIFTDPRSGLRGIHQTPSDRPGVELCTVQPAEVYGSL